MEPNLRENFKKDMDEKKSQLSKAIERIQKRTPLITSQMLMQEGIKPGKSMGDLLKLAEEININEKIEDTEELIKKLKASLLWPKSS